MKLLTAIIKPFKLDKLRAALSAIGITGITVTEVKGFGIQQGHTESYRGAEHVLGYVPKIKLEIVLSEQSLEPVIDVIIATTRTGKIGDGLIYINNLEQVIKIRSGKTGLDAI